MKSIEEIREFFAKDEYARAAGAYIEEVGEHYAKCSMPLDARHKNAVGGVMGGVYFTLADFTFAVATNWENPGVVSLNASITFLGAAKGDRLVAEAVCIKEGRTTNCYRIEIRDGQDRLAVIITITGFRKNQGEKI